MRLSIIIPVYNEEKTILDIIKKIEELDYEIPFEIVIVNDGSTDKTHKKIIEAKKLYKKIKVVYYKKNKGKGHAVRQGFKSSHGDFVVIQDADLEYNPEQIPRLIKPIINNECKVVYGSRFLGNCKNMSFTHFLGNKIFTTLTNLFFNSKLTDMETCYKVIHRDVLEKLDLKSDGFEIEAEITAKILKNGYRIKEIPINYIARSKGQGKKIKWKDGFKNLEMLLRMKFIN